MPHMTWTPSQSDAICARNGTVLVAAAAGSGKTAVLVQRAVERLTDPIHPTSADRLLIVTFTKAAAAEMRARLEKRLYDLLRENPGNTALRRQSVLLSQAHIGTVDSFCAEMVREFFHLLDISPDFSILSDRQKEEFTADAVNAALSEGFENGNISELADAFAAERDDKRLMQMVLTLFEYMQSHPFPERWLEEKAALYESDAPAADTPWGKVLLEYAAETAQYCAGVLENALQEAEGSPELEKAFGSALVSDRTLCEQIAVLAESRDWNGLSGFVKGLSFQRRGMLKGFEDDFHRDKLELLRNEVKKALGELSALFAADEEEFRRELRETGPLVRGLGELTLDFSRRYTAKKREGNFLDYSDLEHFAIRLFLTENGERTQAAREVSARFDEIMIDEYQDINEVQDSLFRAVARLSDYGESNLFMVGDVKQSIYGFRRAMPEIFLARRAAFQKYDREKDAYPAYLTLDRNFRSRSTVTETVNFVFSRLMSKEAGDIDYTGEELLRCGADYEEKSGCETELLLLERDADTDMVEAEAAQIALRIGALLEEGFTVKDGKQERPASYRDFCVLLRSANKYAPLYAKALLSRGIPARASVAGGFFAAAEVSMALAFLQVIDNPNQDIPLLSVLMSPVYGFTEDDVARLRLGDKKRPLYLSLLAAAERQVLEEQFCSAEQSYATEGGRCREVLRDLEYYRTVASTMPSDGFLDLLYRHTGLPETVLCMENGEERLQNLRLLQRYAADYESSGYHGISGFVGFLDRLRRNNADLQSAELPRQSGDSVSIMSIHKSKGLEFPVCIVAGCGRNFTPERGEVFLHPELGLGIKRKDAALSARFTTTAREAIALEIERSAAAEELRVLYVAMTRAKEKLILLAAGTGLEKALLRLSAQITEKGISPYAVRGARNAGVWLMLCALSHPDGGALRELAGAQDGGLVCREYSAPWRISLCEAAASAAVPEEKTGPLSIAPDTALLKELRRGAAFRYPFEEALSVPAKVAASKLTAQRTQELSTLVRPAWLSERGLTPAERGIALHDFMQYADFAAALHDPAAELARLAARGSLTPEQAQAVELLKVRVFLEGTLGRRILASPLVEKEKRFTAWIPAFLAAGESAAPSGTSEEPVVLQGAVDCVFEENGRLHVVDFKTDKVKNMEELWERYGLQLRLYGLAMEQVTGRQVGELILYSTVLNESLSRKYESFADFTNIS